MSELKPCPFCGESGKVQRHNKEREYRVICSNLDCEIFPATHWKSTLKKATEAWNRRVDNDR